MGDTSPNAAMQADAARKQFATVQAELALHRFVLREVDGGFIVSRWNLSRELATLADVERFAITVGARK